MSSSGPTVGGMGLTGVVVRARVRLKPVETAYFTVDTDRTDDLDGLMGLLTDGSDDAYTYSVAWFDSVAKGARIGRSVVTRGRSSTVEELSPKQRRRPLGFDAPQLFTAPAVFPPKLVNRATITAFNEVWWRKAPRRRRDEVQNITTFFHPLDLVGQWNRVYGPAGFLQYQLLVPFGEERALRRCVELISGSGEVSFLNVLKRFGDANPAPLSFPVPGWTLTVDLPVGPGLGPLCRRLDEVVLGAGGRLYLAKESRASADVIAKMYPRLDRVALGAPRRRPRGPVRPRTSPGGCACEVHGMIDALGNPQTLLLLGGASEIALATATEYATARPLRVIMAARPSERRDAGVESLRALGCTVEALDFDAPRHREPRRHPGEVLRRRRRRRLARCVRPAG